ncbi:MULTISPECIES: DegV family protein [unclassified Sporosarcina]|uniref:DegV family protein n=1 Tax=unclassified Sporosarcina TaxID=2647733 RepID=UPI000C16D4BD|nr:MULTISPECIES: DegV family protein [unclassified Sporosarcina]PIC99532.1 fatty acid-binding protein DegV [Sporosarcina sp. P29]PID06487.1 fatty acid-binding protein DegV [Sporosarcina sp. P30]PID09681.1 fatty acid-binding protein DegV [Sporosarcina sp. P31]PID13259.1 fatty acid-binding protein DegV [Sporosarcina sp. P32b]
MKKIHIVTDSTADLTDEVIAQYNIHVVPLTLIVNDKSYIDGVELQPEEFLNLMRDAKELPKSSQPAVGVFQTLYDELGADGSQIISIHMTGGMSGTVKSAETAARASDADVTVIDSMYISHALSFQVLEACRLAEEGKTVAEIVEAIDHVRKSSSLFVVLDVLDNMVKGGRIGKGKAMFGSLMNIKPIASLKDGVYSPVAKVRSHKQVVSYLFDEFKKETAGKVIRSVGIAHANGLAMAEPLKSKIEEMGIHVMLTFTTPIVSTHTGEGAIGFMYYTE